MELVERIELPIELTNGNEGRTKTYKKSARQRSKYERDIALLFGKRKPFSFPVSVGVVRVLGAGQKKWDSSSVLRGNYKEIEDALVACGWFNDDGPKWIVHTAGTQDDSRRHEGPKTIIEVYK